MPSSHPSPMVSPTLRLQLLQHLLPQPKLPQATSTSKVTRKLRLPQVILLLQETSSRELHHHLPQPMTPSRQVPSNVLHAAAEATSPLNAPTSTPWSSTMMVHMTPRAKEKWKPLIKWLCTASEWRWRWSSLLWWRFESRSRCFQGLDSSTSTRRRPKMPYLPHQGRHQWKVHQSHHRWRELP